MSHHGTNERESSHDAGQIEADMNSSSFWAADESSHEVNDGFSPVQKLQTIM